VGLPACVLSVLAALALAACARQSSGDDAAFGQKVRAYLLAHPEVLQEVGQRLEARQAAEEAREEQAARLRVPKLRAALEHDPQDFVANPGGAVTVTEFFDYRCPHCVTAAPSVVALIRQRPDVRFVFKESPIFGSISEHAARAALAVKTAGGDYLGLYQSYMSTPKLDDATIDRLARAKGAAASDLAAGPSSRAGAHIARNEALLNQLGAATPVFVVGDQIVFGDDMQALAGAIAQAHASPSAKG
jgi:protein-disulfide isomerase